MFAHRLEGSVNTLLHHHRVKSHTGQVDHHQCLKMVHWDVSISRGDWRNCGGSIMFKHTTFKPQLLPGKHTTFKAWRWCVRMLLQTTPLPSKAPSIFFIYINVILARSISSLTKTDVLFMYITYLQQKWLLCVFVGHIILCMKENKKVCLLITMSIIIFVCYYL